MPKERDNGIGRVSVHLDPCSARAAAQSVTVKDRHTGLGGENVDANGFQNLTKKRVG